MDYTLKLVYYRVLAPTSGVSLLDWRSPMSMTDNVAKIGKAQDASPMKDSTIVNFAIWA